MREFKRLERLSPSEWELIKPQVGDEHRVAEVAFSFWNGLNSALDLVAAAANAPDWYGHNLDAFVDIINDRPPGKDLFVVKNFRRLKKRDQEMFIELVGTDFEEQRGDGFAYFVIIS